MARIGSKSKPIIVRVQTEERARYVAHLCTEQGWHYIIGLEPDQAEDISDLVHALNRPMPLHVEKTGRNDPCPCGSGKKYKKCCAENQVFGD